MIDASELAAVGLELVQSTAAIAAGSRVVVSKSTQSTYRDARDLAPVDEGYLRDHIELNVSGLTGSVVSNAEYSEYVEDGTDDTSPQPFMGPALERNTRGFVAGLEVVAGSIL